MPCKCIATRLEGSICFIVGAIAETTVGHYASHDKRGQLKGVRQYEILAPGCSFSLRKSKPRENRNSHRGTQRNPIPTVGNANLVAVWSQTTMKKYWHDPSYKRFHRKRSIRSLNRRLRFKNYRRIENLKKNGLSKTERKIRSQAKKHSHRITTVKAPEVMCFLEMPDEMSAFIAILKMHEEKKRPVYVDLSDVQTLELNAVTVLLSVMVRFKSSRVKFNGNLPHNQQAARLLVESKFFDHLQNRFAESSAYDLPGSSIYTHGKLRVDSEFSDKLIGYAAETVWGESRRCQGLQLAFIELMQNTNNHASPQQGGQHYWISLHHIKEENKVVFTFVDFGVGIFESLSAKRPGEKLYNVVMRLLKRWGQDRCDVLRRIFAGELHKTATQQYYRGKGLPALHKAFRENRISKLAMITNNVFYNSQDEQYVQLGKNFSGTLITWELSESNESKPRIN